MFPQNGAAGNPTLFGALHVKARNTYFLDLERATYVHFLRKKAFRARSRTRCAMYACVHTLAALLFFPSRGPLLVKR